MPIPGEHKTVQARILAYASAGVRARQRGRPLLRTRVDEIIARGSSSQRSTMKTHVLKGSKQEIAENLVRISGEVREAIVFEEEPAPAAPGARTPDTEDIFAEMRPFM